MTWKDFATFVIGLIIVALFGAVMAALLLHPVALSEGQTALINMAFGFLGAAFGAVVTFYFGSSLGSSKKDDTISQMATNIGTGTGNGTRVSTSTPTTIITTDRGS